MDFIKRLFRHEKEKDNKQDDRGEGNRHLSKKLADNVALFKETFKDCDDVVYRDFTVGDDQRFKMTLIYIDGMANKNLINENILRSIMLDARQTHPKTSDIQDIFELIKNSSLSTSDLKEIDDVDKIIVYVLSGLTLLLIDGYDRGIIFETRGWQTRSIAPPEAEMTIRGPQDSFVETLRINTALVRRRIRDTRLKLKSVQIGTRSKTDVIIAYIEDIADENVLEEVKNRLKTINIDAVLESGYIEQLIEDCWYSPFPQIEITQRPDKVAAALYEGRVSVLVDNSPFALLMPATVSVMIQSPEDYYMRWPIASVIRLLRFLSIFIELYLPALYIAITSYNPGMIPTTLSLYIAATRATVPFPSFIEAFMMMGVLEILREGGIRLPTPVSQTLGIVGAIVIGSAAVQAGIVSPFMVIVVAITAMASFVVPNYSLSLSMRLLTFGFMIMATVFGLYGIYIGTILMLSHMVILKSFGVPYIASFMSYTSRDLADIVVRFPLHFMRYRPMFLQQKDKVRFDDKREEKIKSREAGQDDKK
ncbi:spore germination protein [Caldanaerobius fijiensis DSM 17918]|uniref:Spore germination protein n=1 Tax=Caldanaerobius fijiensis DSM 17918 TaxID=1121256 RepID=A0A1M4Z6U5_9THEO|nr:spore germination protein [Caldanaerobius fijiensis]SHF13492.1 spore germination protein [Caldanaerobius fijiensis DSM 17918]